MRIALLADLHANREAVEACLKAVRKAGCDRIVLLGDIVGYNADPSACLEIVRAMNCPTVKGNHDDDASNERSLETLSEAAAEAVWSNAANRDRQSVPNSLAMRRRTKDHPIAGAFACN